MASRPLASAIAVVVVATVAAACGEDVDFGSAPTLDAATREASALDAAAGDAGGTPTDDGAPCSTMSDAGATCRSNGQYCSGPGDCCSARCDDSYCLPSGTCSPPGAPCEYGTQCCTERCTPGPRSGLSSCGPYCESNGASCDDAQDCCSLACNGGQCGGAICNVVDGTCVEDSGCCSGRCDGGRCMATSEACLPSGESCSGDAGFECCSGVCDPTGRCDVGPGVGPGGCRETSSPCVVDSDCCRGTCTPDSQQIPVCTARCLGPGNGCNSNDDCCSGACGGLPSTCRECPASMFP